MVYVVRWVGVRWVGGVGDVMMDMNGGNSKGDGVQYSRLGSSSVDDVVGLGVGEEPE